MFLSVLERPCVTLCVSFYQVCVWNMFYYSPCQTHAKETTKYTDLMLHVSFEVTSILNLRLDLLNNKKENFQDLQN